MKRHVILVWAWLALMVAAPAAAQTTTSATLSSITCPGTGCLQVSPTATGQLAVQLAAGFQGTAVFEKTADDVDWRPWSVTPSTGGSAVTSATSYGIWNASTDGSLRYRVRFSLLFTGSSVATFNYIQAAALPTCALNESVIYNGTAWACFTPPNTASTYSNPSWISSLAWSKITGTPTTLAGYGIIDAQPLDSDLTAIAALATTSYGRSVLTWANIAAGRTALSLVPGTDVQAWSANLDSLSANAPSYYLSRANHTGTQAWSTIVSTPTTLAGYAITDAQPLNPNLSPYQVTRQEATPSAPTASLVATASGNATNGSHVFAVVFNTVTGHTPVSVISNAVTVDGTHKQVNVVLPASSGNFVVSRDVYASKAGTTSPLYLVSSSPVVNWPTANPDMGLSDTYVFNIADASLTATVAPTSNTTADVVFAQTAIGASLWGNNVSAISSRNGYYFNENGATNVGVFQRDDPGEARLALVASGTGAFAFPTYYAIYSGATNTGGVTTYAPVPSGVTIGVFGIRGSRNSGGSYNADTGIGLVYSSTELWSNSASGSQVALRATITGTNTRWTPFAANSTDGVVLRGAGATSATYALRVYNSTPLELLNIDDAGTITTLSGATLTGPGTVAFSGGQSLVGTVTNKLAFGLVPVLTFNGFDVFKVSLANGHGDSYTNVFAGYKAGNLWLTADTGYWNTGVGYGALAKLHGDAPTAFSNVAVGGGAGGELTTGTTGTYLGTEAGGSSVTSTDQTFVGYHSGIGCRGNTNIGIGAFAMKGHTSNCTGSDNTGLGYQSFAGLTTGGQNVGLGYDALFSLTSGNENLSVGFDSLDSLTTGSSNLVIGYKSGNSLTTGSSNVIIGYQINAPANNSTNYVNLAGILTGNSSTLAITFPGAATFSSTVTVPGLASLSGTRYVCSSTTGLLSGSASACSGTEQTVSDFAKDGFHLPSFSEWSAMQREITSLRLAVADLQAQVIRK